jgi:hypothetical protein
VTDRLRRRGSLAAAVLLLAAPALTSCGFDYATDRVNTIAPGANDRSGTVKVLGAVVIAEAEGSGVFVATLANSGGEEDSLDQLGAEGGEEGSPTLAVAGDDVPTVEIPAGGRVSLIEEGGIPVEGEFGAGDFVEISLTFGSGQTTTIEANVVRACFQYSPDKLGELNFPGGATTGSTGAETTESESTEGEAAEGEAETPDPYSCEAVESEVWGEGEEPHHGGEE